MKKRNGLQRNEFVGRSPNRLLGMREAAQRLGVSLRTAERYASQGWLPAVKIGGHYVVLESALEGFAREQALKGSKAGLKMRSSNP